MTFLRLLEDKDKKRALTQAIRNGGENVFEVSPASFHQVPGTPFSYWVSEDIRQLFSRLQTFESEERVAQHGASTKDDFRFLRTWWEQDDRLGGWIPFAKGGKRSNFYSDIHVNVWWKDDARELEAALLKKYPYLGESANWILHRECNYLQPGLSWPLRGSIYSSQLVPKGCIFSVAGKMAFVPLEELLTWLAIFNSKPFDYLIGLFAGKVGGVQYEIGLISGIPVPPKKEESWFTLSRLARLGWSIARSLSSDDELSHAFLMPVALRNRIDGFDRNTIRYKLDQILAEVNSITFDLYGFSEADRRAAGGITHAKLEVEEEPGLPAVDAILSWAVGVAFGRFDWRLATGEREMPPDPDPFDPLPTKSPGMLPDGNTPFHAHDGILVDDAGHQHDLARLVEEVLLRVDVDAPSNVRSWLKRDFFKYHLQEYSQSRRKAPIYWPLATSSGSYTLWIYYPTISSQTLFGAVNDFVEPKLKHVGQELSVLRAKGSARSSDEEKRLEQLDSLELELTELRDQLLKVAPSYKPSHDDGVQITASPLWTLFQDRSWQKALHDTWKKLEKGDYDWAHLAMNYWPERVREKCKKEKSLAIAHGLETEFVNE